MTTNSITLVVETRQRQQNVSYIVDDSIGIQSLTRKLAQVLIFTLLELVFASVTDGKIMLLLSRVSLVVTDNKEVSL